MSLERRNSVEVKREKLTSESFRDAFKVNIERNEDEDDGQEQRKDAEEENVKKKKKTKENKDNDVLSSSAMLRVGHLRARAEDGFSKEYSEDHVLSLYEVQQVIGEGASGVVCLGVERASGEEVAIKIIPRTRLQLNPKLEREIRLLESLDHPNIIKLRHAYATPDNLYIVMELAIGLELFDMICQQRCYSEVHAVAIVRTLLGAINYMHQMGVCHRDLKV
jgi:serine/threonine protein kinase